MHPDKIHVDGTIRVVIVPEALRSTIITVQGNYILVELYAAPKDNIYAELTKLTAQAIQFYATCLKGDCSAK